MDTLLGITAGDWWRLLRENRFAVDPPYWGRAAALTVLSCVNSIYRRKEERAYGSEIARAEIRSPLFIIGHWRTGTTLLHNLLALDERFAYPNLFQITHPHSFLIREAAVVKALADAPPRKRPMDNMKVTFRSPGEDEFAVSVLSLRSPVVAWSFPRNEARYDRYLTFRGVPEEDVARWRKGFLWFLKKLTYRYDRPLLLKSPAHTGRIRMLLELFPDARFVHMHREPYTVFRSTRRLYEKGVSRSYLQRPDGERIDEGILRRFQEMYEVFFEERALIPEGRYHELAFEDLERDKVGQVALIYERLGLPGFGKVEPKLRRYVESIAGYKKNKHPPLPESMRRRIAQAWRRGFEEWGYPI